MRAKRLSEMPPFSVNEQFGHFASLERKFGDAVFWQRIVVVGYEQFVVHGRKDWMRIAVTAPVAGGPRAKVAIKWQSRMAVWRLFTTFAPHSREALPLPSVQPEGEESPGNTERRPS